MRIPTPCSQNLDAMPRGASGEAHCTACDRDVVDLRRTPQKRALAIIQDLRAQGDGSVCVRVRATRDGVPVFKKDPTVLSRFVMPAMMAGSLAACAPSASADRTTTPIAMIPTEQLPVASNVNTFDPISTTTPVVVPVSTGRTPTQQPGVAPIYDTVEMAGGLAWGG